MAEGGSVVFHYRLFSFIKDRIDLNFIQIFKIKHCRI